jgi:hypothetical protein
MNIILLGIYIILMALTVWGAYTEGFSRGREEVLKRWEETEDKRLKAFKSQTNKSGPYDEGEEYWGR